MQQYNVYEAKNQLSRLVRRAEAEGEGFIIARYNKPILNCFPIVEGEREAEEDVKDLIDSIDLSAEDIAENPKKAVKKIGIIFAFARGAFLNERKQVSEDIVKFQRFLQKENISSIEDLSLPVLTTESFKKLIAGSVKLSKKYEASLQFLDSLLKFVLNILRIELEKDQKMVEVQTDFEELKSLIKKGTTEKFSAVGLLPDEIDNEC